MSTFTWHGVFAQGKWYADNHSSFCGCPGCALAWLVKRTFPACDRCGRPVELSEPIPLWLESSRFRWWMHCSGDPQFCDDGDGYAQVDGQEKVPA